MFLCRFFYLNFLRYFKRTIKAAFLRGWWHATDGILRHDAEGTECLRDVMNKLARLVQLLPLQVVSVAEDLLAISSKGPCDLLDGLLLTD